MNLYLAVVDEFFTFELFGDSECEKRRRHLLIEAEDIHAAWKTAEKTAETNVKFGPRPLGIEVISVGSVMLPAAITFISPPGKGLDR